MTLMAIVGELGAGKTLTLTYLALRAYLKSRVVFANYYLSFPHIPVTSVDEIDKMRTGFFAADELWLWVDARAAQSKKNKVISGILLNSRRRGVDFAYTCQSFRQMDIRVRNVTDYIAFPMMMVGNHYCKVNIVSNFTGNLIRSFKYKTAEIFELYDTHEEIKPLIDDEEDKTAV